MKKPKSSRKISIAGRKQPSLSSIAESASSLANRAPSDFISENGIGKTKDLASNNSGLENFNKPLIDLLAISSEFFVFTYSPSLKSLVTWSDNAQSVLGVKDSRIVREGNLFLRHIHSDDRFQILNDLEAALEGKSPFRATYRWIRPDRNEMRWLHCRATLKKTSTNQVFEGIILDISDELDGPLKYFSASESVHSVLSVLPGLVVILDRELRILRLSQPSEMSDFGFGDFAFKKELFKVGQAFSDCFSDKQLVAQIHNIANLIFSGDEKADNFRIIERSRSYKVDFFVQTLGSPLSPESNVAVNENTLSSLETTSYSNEPIGLVCVVSDVSNLVQLESRVADLQRTESLRLLSAGIGHHFNNTLQTIIGQATIIQSHYNNRELVNSACDSIAETSLKAAELTRQLFSNIEKKSDCLTPIDANLALSDAINNIHGLFDSGFEVNLVLGQLPLVKASYEGLRSVFEAILKNARDAIKNKLEKQQLISIKTYAVDLRDFEIDPLPAGSYSVINITDSGIGMDSQTLSHCLEPFYTTKDPDLLTGINLQGAGLGLSQAFSFVRSLGGTIKIDSQKPIGSCVQIFLPSDPEQNFQQIDQTSFLISQRNKSHSPKVLLIDDDQIVSTTVQMMIKSLNYECVIANNFSSALEQIKHYSNSIELVLLDVVLPNSDSNIILKRLKQIKSSLKIVGFSGAAPQRTQSLLLAGALEILEKPVQISTLKKILERYLSPNVLKIAI